MKCFLIAVAKVSLLALIWAAVAAFVFYVGQHPDLLPVIIILIGITIITIFIYAFIRAFIWTVN